MYLQIALVEVEQAAGAGKLIGTYHYISGSGAVAEADFYLDNIKNWIGKYMLCLDWKRNRILNGVIHHT